MRTFLTRLALVSMFLMSLLAAGSAAALADTGNGNGAVQDPGNGPVNTNDCSDDNGTDTYCYISKGEQHNVCTPTGSCNGQLNISSSCIIEIDDATGNTVFSECASGHLLFHTDPSAGYQVDHEAFNMTFTDASGFTCTMSAQYHEANGQIQYDRTSGNCP